HIMFPRSMDWSIIQRALRSRRRRRRRVRCRRSRTFPLGFMEALEDRTVPASMAWALSTGGDWDVAANWVNQANANDHHIPTSADDVLVNVPGITVTHASGASDSAKSLLVQQG